MPLVLDGTTGVQGNSGAIVLDTAKTATGTAVDFTGIPSWVKRITVMFNGVSTNGTSSIQVQLGAGSVTTTGYSSYAGYVANSATTVLTSNTSGLHISGLSNVSVLNGFMTIVAIGGNIWVANHTMANAPATTVNLGGGQIALSGALNRVRITTVNGTDTFDAGTINIIYE